MTLKKITATALVAAAAVFAATFGDASSAKTTTTTTKTHTTTTYSKKLRAAKGTKASSYRNLTPASSLNKRGAKAPEAPANKGGKKGRGATYYLHVDNHTPYYSEVYVGGTYAGTVAPYGDIWPVISSGTTTVQAVANFDDGSTLNWGPYRAESYGDTLVVSLYK